MKLSFTCIIFRASLWFQIISYSRMSSEAYFCTFVQNQIYYFIRQIHKMEEKEMCQLPPFVKIFFFIERLIERYIII